MSSVTRTMTWRATARPAPRASHDLARRMMDGRAQPAEGMRRAQEPSYQSGDTSESEGTGSSNRRAWRSFPSSAENRGPRPQKPISCIAPAFMSSASARWDAFGFDGAACAAPRAAATFFCASLDAALLVRAGDELRLRSQRSARPARAPCQRPRSGRRSSRCARRRKLDPRRLLQRDDRLRTRILRSRDRLRDRSTSAPERRSLGRARPRCPARRGSGVARSRAGAPVRRTPPGRRCARGRAPRDAAPRASARRAEDPGAHAAGSP